MIDDKNPSNIELLRLAKELAYSDYNNKKADLHNQWLAESDYMWRTQRLKVAYPPLPKFPTENDIATRAERLLEFLNRPRPDLEQKQVRENIKTMIDDVANTHVEENTSPTEEIVQETSQVDDKKIDSMLNRIKNVWR